MQTQIRILFTFHLQLFHRPQNNSRFTIAEKDQALLYDSMTHNTERLSGGCISFSNCLKFSLTTKKNLTKQANKKP